MIPSRTVRSLVITTALATGLVACQRDAERTDDAAVAPSEAPGPLTYESQTPFAKVSLKLPEAVKTEPALYKAVYDQEVKDLMTYTEGAQADRTEAGNDSALPPYEKAISYNGVVQTGRLFSAIRTDFDYSGGAHPNTVATALLWDRSTQERISPLDLFAKGSNLAPVERTLCNAVNEAKKQRPGATPVGDTSDTWSCPRLKDMGIVLAPGSVKDRAGGLTFLINAYSVGPYAEGAYYLTLPTSSFQTLLNPAYAGQFSGQPTKAGDVTADLTSYPGD